VRGLTLKVGDLVVSKAHSNYVGVVPSRLVVQTTIGGNGRGVRYDKQYIVLEDEPDNWKLAKNFFVVSRA
jgi:hypothetical protein